MARLSLVAWWMIAAALMFFSVAGNAQNPPAKDDKPSTPPSVTVSFDHLLLRENESANVDVWLANSTDQDESVTLTVAGTDQIRWHEGACKSTQITFPLALGTLAAHSTMHQTLCAVVVSQVYVGDYAELFSFEYATPAPQAQRGVVTIEKTVKLSFLGTDSIAGIPLAFACFILPGFCFWLMAQAVGGFKSMGQALGDKTIYSIMVSVAVVLIATWISPVIVRLGGTPLSVSLGVSIAKLALLSAIGAFAGLIIGWRENAYQQSRAKKEQQLKESQKLKADESYDVVLQKLLALNPNLVRPKYTVRLVGAAKTAYSGSLYGKTETGHVLVGWFKVQLPSGNQMLEQWKKEKKLDKIVGWARQNNVTIEKLYPLQVSENDGAAKDDPNNDYIKSWSDAEVSGVNVDLQQARDPLQIV